MDENDVVLGERYRDTITGWEGTATAMTRYLHGCNRVCLTGVMAGKPEDYTFDAPQLERIEDGARLSSMRTGGDRPSLPRVGL